MQRSSDESGAILAKLAAALGIGSRIGAAVNPPPLMQITAVSSYPIPRRRGKYKPRRDRYLRNPYGRNR